MKSLARTAPILSVQRKQSSIHSPHDEFPTQWLLRTAMPLIVVMSIAFAVGTPAAAEEQVINCLFDQNRVIEVSIELPVKSWNELCKQNRDAGKVFSGSNENPFTHFKGNITVDGIDIGSVGIRKKGFLGSLDDKFPSLKIKFNEYEDQSPIPGLDDLTLNNNKQDTSLMSQLLAYKLFNAAGVQAPRCNFARVTVNGKYLGLYSNVESIGKPFLERRFGNNSGNLYEGTLADFYPKAIDRLDAKTNKKNHDRSKIARLATLLATKEDLPLDEIHQLLDIDNFLRFWALESLIGFWDGYSNNQNNFWVYDNVADGKFYFMPWGADAAFMSGGFPGFGPRGPVSVYAEGMLANRLYHDRQIVERYRETMRWLLANVWNEAELLKSIDRVEGLVTKHLHARQSGAPRAMSSVRSFIKGRRQSVEKELEDWPVRVGLQPRKPMYIVEIGSARGSFSTEWSDNTPADIAKKGRVDLQLQLDGKPVDFKQAGASVHRQKPGGFPFGFGGANPPGPPMANIVITGVRDSDGKLLTLTLNVDQKVLTDSVGKPLTVQGSFSSGEEGGGFFMPFGRRTISGNVTLAKVGTKSNDAIEGEFELAISEMRGGFMDRRPGGPGGPGGGPPPGAIFGMEGVGGSAWSPVALVSLREVQEDLSATDTQRKQVQEAQHQLDEKTRANASKMQEALELPEEEHMERTQSIRQKMNEANRYANSKIDLILDMKQRERLKQLQRQREGSNVFARPDVVDVLKLTEEQQDRIRSIRDAAQPASPGPFGQTDDQRRQSVQEMVAILNDDQKNKWLSMTGKEFRFPNTPLNPGPGPGQPAQ